MAIIDNLISYYKLDETSGTTVYDAHGSNNGTNNGATQNVTGKINTAYDFDGTNDYIDVGDVTSNLISINLWTYYTGGTSGESTMIGRYDYCNSKRDYRVEINLGRLDFSIGYGTGATQILDTVNFPTNQWVMVTAIYDGAYMKLYKNNVLVQNKSVSTRTAQTGISTYIGKMNNECPVLGYYNGKIDEVGIWSRVLTSTEITDLYNSGSGLAYPFTSNITINPTALSLSTTSFPPVISTGPVPAFNLSLSLLEPTICCPGEPNFVKVGTGGRGTRIIRTSYPVEQGLIAGFSRLDGRTFALKPNTSKVNKNAREGL